MNIAVLITCHNRKAKTLACLEHLFKAEIPEGYEIEVFLVDDGSTDGTSVAVQENYPTVNIIQGTGNLFWNRGMRLAWETAAKTKEYDFYLWLNDDTNIDNDAIVHLLECYNEILLINKKSNVIVGACRNSLEQNEFSYGGRDKKGPVLPNGKLQSCKYINGNIVLISGQIFKKAGNLSADYTHAIGDFDYGLRVIQEGFQCHTTKNFIATCLSNNKFPQWCNPKENIFKRWKAFHSPLGLNISEYKIFIKKFWPKQYLIFILKAYVKCIFPMLYHKFSFKK